MNGMGNKGNMTGEQDTGNRGIPMSENEMQGMQTMSDMITEMQTIINDMMSSKDMSKMPDMMSKMDDMQGIMNEMMGKETMPSDEYNNLSPEEKDKADEQEIMGKH